MLEIDDDRLRWIPGSSDPLDVLTIGRIGVDPCPLQDGVGLEDVTSCGKHLGGSATNVAIAASRSGRSAAVITRVGEAPFGRYARRELVRLGHGQDDGIFVGRHALTSHVSVADGRANGSS